MAEPISSTFSGRTLPRLAGRDREQAVLRDRLAATLAGHGSLVLVGGEAGIGKTTLAEALCAEATSQGALVLVGHCYDLTETPPYGPWAEALAAVPRDAASPPTPDLAGENQATGREALFAAVRDYLAARSTDQALVLLLEDLHWADPASLDLLRAVARGVTGVPLLCVATYRSDELTRRHPLYQLLPVLVREARATRLDVRPLDAASLRLLGRHYRLPERDEARLTGYLVERAEGNPFFAGELLRTLEEEGALRPDGDAWHLGNLAAIGVPSLLRQVIDARLDRLSGDGRVLLAAGAIVGQEVSLALWQVTSGADDETLATVMEAAQAAHLLVPTADGARFAHALIREALYEGTLPLRRRAWHLRCAEALLAAPAPDPDAVAHHLQRAGDPRAAEWLVRAGLRARGAVAWLTAAERFAGAAALLAGDASRARGWLLFYSGRLAYFADTARTLRAVEEAEPLARLAGDAALLAHCRFLRGLADCLGGRLRGGLATMAEAVSALDAQPGDLALHSGDDLALVAIAALLGGDDPVEARLTAAGAVPAARLPAATLALYLAFVGRYREALALAEPLIARLVAAQGGDLVRGAAAHQGLGHAYAALGRAADARHECARAREGALAVADAWMAETTLWFELRLAVLPYYADDPAARAGLVAEATRYWAQERGTAAAAAHGTPAALPPALLEGRWDEAARLARGALATATSAYVQWATAALGLLARHRGSTDEAWAWVRALHPAGPATLPGDSEFPAGLATQVLAAELALDASDLAAADRWIAAHGRWLAWAGVVLWQADHELLRARRARQAGDPDAARAHAEAALALAIDPRQPLALLAAHRTLGELATAAGRHAEAQDQLDTALALADACAAPYERALTLLALAELHQATGAGPLAATMLAEARATFTDLGAAPALARSEALAARIAVAPAVPDPVLPFGLSAREAEVLRLVARGLTDAQVAERLFLSPYTVKAHLRTIYAKTGAENRTAATRLAAERGLV